MVKLIQNLWYNIVLNQKRKLFKPIETYLLKNNFTKQEKTNKTELTQTFRKNNLEIKLFAGQVEKTQKGCSCDNIPQYISGIEYTITQDNKFFPDMVKNKIRETNKLYDTNSQQFLIQTFNSSLTKLESKFEDKLNYQVPNNN